MDIPRELKEKSIWLVRSGKVPYSPKVNDGKVKKAKSTRPDTWGNYDAAKNMIGKSYKHGVYDKDNHVWEDIDVFIDGLGIGIIPPYVVIDLDHVINSKGDILPSAMEIIGEVSSYTEISPSGTGVHIIAKYKGDIDIDKGRKGATLSIPSNFDCEDGKLPTIEIYKGDRYITYTGQIYGEYRQIEERGEEVKKIFDKYFKKDKKGDEKMELENRYTHNEIIQKLLESEERDDFFKLYNGDISKYDNDDNKADLAYCNYIARYTDDFDTIDKAYRISPLGSKQDRIRKWIDERDDYKIRTINKALEDKTRRPKIKFKRGKRGKVLDIIENLEEVLKYHETSIKYDVLTQKVICKWRGLDSILSNLISECRNLEYNANPSTLKGFVKELALRNKFNSFEEYLKKCESLHTEVDKSEIEKLISTLEFDTDDTEIIDFYKKLIKKWLVSVVVLNLGTGIDDIESPQIEGCLVLKGGQGIGKTTWLKRLVPTGYFKEGATLQDNKDSKMEVYKYAVVELGELETTTRKNATGFLKNELTRTKVEFRPPFGTDVIDFARCTVFCGSVNEEVFLKDATGNRRFWILPIKSIDLDTKIDIDKLWAEVIRLYRDGTKWTLNKEERKKVEELSNEYLDAPPSVLDLCIVFDFSQPIDEWKYYMTAETIGELVKRELGKGMYKNEIARGLRYKGCEQIRIRIENRQLRTWNVPDFQSNDISGLSIYVKSDEEYKKLNTTKS